MKIKRKKGKETRRDRVKSPPLIRFCSGINGKLGTGKEEKERKELKKMGQ